MGMKRATRKQLRTIRRRRLALALVGAIAAPAALAQSTSCVSCLPYYGQVRSGTVTTNFDNGGVIRPTGDVGSTTMTINQTTQGAIIDWGSFNIAPDHLVDFNVPVNGVTLNRVIGIGYGPSMSNINGSLRSNGSVFLINQSGVLFGGGAEVNVGSLVASTFDISNADFNTGVNSGRYVFQSAPFVDTDFDGDADAYAAAPVSNGGLISATAGGSVALLGSSISNTGSITTPGGSAVFGSGQQITLDFFGDGLTQVTVNGAGVLTSPTICDIVVCTYSQSSVTNEGVVQADGGQILMRIVGDGNGGIVNSGTLRAQGIVSRAGRVELTAPGGAVAVGSTGAGIVDVSGGPGTAGGTIVLRGAGVTLLAWEGGAASLDASGSVTGGTVDIEAETQGVLLDAGTVINASGGSGAGGEVRVNAAGTLAAFGAINASGGTNGGSVTTSWGGQFDLRGLRVDAGGGAGAGTWTLAPTGFMEVINGNAVGTAGTLAMGNTLQDAELNAALNSGASVVVNSTDSVYFTGAQITTDSTLDLSFTINADDAISGSDFSITSSDGALDMVFNADASGANTGFAYIWFDGAELASNGGDISMYGRSDPVAGAASGYASGIHLDNSAVTTAGGNVLLRGESTGLDAGPDDAGVRLDDSTIDSGGGSIVMHGVGDDITRGISSSDSMFDTGGGDFSMTGTANGSGDGVYFITGAASGAPEGIFSQGGNISIVGLGGGYGVFIPSNYTGVISSAGGNILIDGEGGTEYGSAIGIAMDSAGGSIEISGTSTDGGGLRFSGNAYEGMSSGGGNIRLFGEGATAGTVLVGGGYGMNYLDSDGGDITIIGTASAVDAVGVLVEVPEISSGAGDVAVTGTSVLGTGIQFNNAGVTTTSGAISLTGIGATVGLGVGTGLLETDTGHIDLRGHGSAAGAEGLVIGEGMAIDTAGGGIDLSGQGGGAGVRIETGASVDAGDSLVVLRAGNNGIGDAVVIEGTISSALGVNLRPGGVDAGGALFDRLSDDIQLGGADGFALSGDELGLIDSPELVIGSNLHAGGIQVTAAIARDGNLTLQNDAGDGGISIQAALNVGTGTLALLSGGTISQTAAGAISAHSLLARTGGDVLLAAANNNVADTTLAGSAGGDFEFQDADTLAIGTVSASGFDAAGGTLAVVTETGVTAGGDAFIRNLQGDMTLNAGVTATNIDLVTAGRLQNLAGATLTASGDWRVWASTWEGEARGGLAGSGALPNLYGCAYLGACGVTVPATDNHFIYVQQPTALIAFDSFSREYGLPNPALTFTVSGAILGDTAANVATGTGTTTATIGSNVGAYPILGSFTSAAGYNLTFTPGTLSVTPATLIFAADPFVRYLGFANPLFTGSVEGLRNGDTVADVFSDGITWTSFAGALSPIGFYPIIGTGADAQNYVVVQAASNATALQVIPMPQISTTPTEFIRDPVDTYVYDSNIGTMPVCAVNASIDDQQLTSSGDALSTEWSKVRSRPNLTNCFDNERRNGCGDF